jgi:hypothetical protein
MAMPFLAQGGSSVVTNWAIVALLIRLSDKARSRLGVPKGEEAAAVTAHGDRAEAAR